MPSRFINALKILPPAVAHALVRAVFAPSKTRASARTRRLKPTRASAADLGVRPTMRLLRTQNKEEPYPRRSHECERGKHECVRYCCCCSAASRSESDGF